ncbi:5053_t:CDS:1, partial [Funneliformis caledonium]
KAENVGIRSLEITGVSIESITGLVCLCKKEEVSKLVLRGLGIDSVN